LIQEKVSDNILGRILLGQCSKDFYSFKFPSTFPENVNLIPHLRYCRYGILICWIPRVSFDLVQISLGHSLPSVKFQSLRTSLTIQGIFQVCPYDNLDANILF